MRKQLSLDYLTWPAAGLGAILIAAGVWIGCQEQDDSAVPTAPARDARDADHAREEAWDSPAVASTPSEPSDAPPGLEIIQALMLMDDAQKLRARAIARDRTTPGWREHWKETRESETDPEWRAYNDAMAEVDVRGPLSSHERRYIELSIERLRTYNEIVQAEFPDQWEILGKVIGEGDSDLSSPIALSYQPPAHWPPAPWDVACPSGGQIEERCEECNDQAWDCHEAAGRASYLAGLREYRRVIAETEAKAHRCLDEQCAPDVLGWALTLYYSTRPNQCYLDRCYHIYEAGLKEASRKATRENRRVWRRESRICRLDDKVCRHDNNAAKGVPSA